MDRPPIEIVQGPNNLAQTIERFPASDQLRLATFVEADQINGWRFYKP